MSTIRNRLALAIGACLSYALCSANGFAQGYPSKPVRIIVPISAGSGVDIIARALEQCEALDIAAGCSGRCGSRVARI